MKVTGLSLLGIAGSIAVHLAVAVAAVPFLMPKPIPQQHSGESQLALAAMPVKRSRAVEQAPSQTVAEAAPSGGTRAGGQPVPRTRANPQRLSGQMAGAIPVASERMMAKEPQQNLRSALKPSGVRGEPVAVFADPTVSVELAAQAAIQVQDAQPVAAPSPVGTTTVVPRSTEQPAIAQMKPHLPRVSASLDWSGAANMALDTQSVATLSAFLSPGTVAQRDLHDRMTQVMAAPPCARIQTIFDPASGTLELRGHVPEPTLRAPLLAALQAQVGTGLPLRDALRILPHPQCDLLDGIATLGLPQSEEQLTDPDLVGENAQTREYSFAEGDRLTIAMEAPDYPAYVYVDYFDAAGQVIHLRPNAQSLLQSFDPGQAFTIGGAGDIDLRIAPPFGQDIAVAFAASAPLYEGVRPLVEPAVPYLDALRAMIAERRATDPMFRGEWVYVFVETQPR
ncbi:DUF4384 domain-containing protein [Pseudosulfitobacter sp. DSM 107133]|uniref:DUF4384 domain-containing protein n=1 Tax=Pseudosulfitobacter sp. DSM 107133 TaxID=2883100 RepID=UPI000DF42DE0|nr:DUF4384 domain-containing protein [Pseudosulfitobacter sp. DSM 107133]UOA28970.1 hypothetical protein DSM107133_03729 [Pseudosulfitobacter sp. DSM 107133]